MTLRRTALLLLFLAGPLVAGCNIFEGFSEPGTSDDPEVLIEDADLALQQGQPQKALAYLEKAVERDPNHARARAKLAVVQLQAHDIDVLTLKGLVDGFREEAGGQAGKGASDGEVCLYEPSPGLTATPFSYLTSPEYQRISDARRVLWDANANGERFMEAYISASAGNLSPANYGTEAERTRLFEQAMKHILSSSDGLSTAEARQEAAEFLITYGIAEFSVSLVALQQPIFDYGLQWVRLQKDGRETGISICAPTREKLDAALGAVACEVPQLRSGSIALRTRAENLEGALSRFGDDQSIALETAKEVDELVAKFEAEFPAATCGS